MRESVGVVSGPEGDGLGGERTGKRDASLSAAWEADMARHYGPLTGREWLELDHWAFQEMPRRDYAAFCRLAAHHGVPLHAWLDRHPGQLRGKAGAAAACPAGRIAAQSAGRSRL